MNLAAKAQDKLPLQDQTRMSELTLNEALRLVADKTAKKAKPDLACDRATKTLLENLWMVDARIAEHKAKAAIAQLQELLNKRGEPTQKAA
jgi:hypothetical protein